MKTVQTLKFLILAALVIATLGAGYAAPVRAAEKVKVTFMTWEGADTNAAIDKGIATFEAANPDIDVERIASPATDYGQKISSMVVASELPDLFWAGNDTEQAFGAQGVLFDWTAIASKDASFKRADFAPLSLENWTSPDGKLYGLPTLMNTYGVWYNADLFKKANLPLPKVGWTYDEMFAAAKALTVKDGSKVKTYGIYNLATDPFTIGNCAVSNGGTGFADRVIEPTKFMADAAYKACLKQYADAVQAGYITPPGYPGDGLTESFIAGDLPMLSYGQWLAPSFLKAAPKFKFDFAPLAAGKDNVQTYDAVGIASPKGIKNPDAAWKVAKFLSTDLWKTVLVDAPVAPAAHVPSSAPYFETLKKAGLNQTADSINYMLQAPKKQAVRLIATWSTKGNDAINAVWSDVLTGKRPLDSVDKLIADLNALVPAKK